MLHRPPQPSPPRLALSAFHPPACGALVSVAAAVGQCQQQQAPTPVAPRVEVASGEIPLLAPQALLRVAQQPALSPPGLLSRPLMRPLLPDWPTCWA